MRERIAESSPRSKARLAGVFFLLYSATGAWGYFVSGEITGGDAPATAANILANETLFRLAIAANLVSAACYLVAAVLLYELFKPVDRTVSLFAAFFNLTSCAIGAFDSLFQLAALDVLRGGSYLSVFSAQQLQALALLFLKLNIRALDMGQIFFGFQWLAIGYLILRSTFLPRILGAISAFAGLWYLTRLYPPLVTALSPYSLIVPGVGVMMLILWRTLRAPSGATLNVNRKPFIRTIRKSTDDGRILFSQTKHHKLRRPALTDKAYAKRNMISPCR
jgi:hypothetical protein